MKLASVGILIVSIVLAFNPGLISESNADSVFSDAQTGGQRYGSQESATGLTGGQRHRSGKRCAGITVH